jgi:hypothetical protein
MNNDYFIYEEINNCFSILEQQLENYNNIKKFDFYNKIIYKQIFHNTKIQISIILKLYCKNIKLRQNINNLFNIVFEQLQQNFSFDKKSFIEANYYLQKNKILELLKNYKESFTNYKIKKNFVLMYICVLVILIIILGN